MSHSSLVLIFGLNAPARANTDWWTRIHSIRNSTTLRGTLYSLMLVHEQTGNNLLEQLSAPNDQQIPTGPKIYRSIRTPELE